MITDRDIDILRSIAKYYILSRPQIQRLCFPTDTSGRVARRRLQYLVDARYLNRQQMLFCAPQGGTPTTVYFPAALGNELLSEHFNDDRYRLTPVIPPIQHHIPHWIAASETHIAFDHAVDHTEGVSIDSWVNEWDIANKDETEPQKRFRLFTMIRETPRLVCAPDAGFLLNVREHKKVFFLEQDRGTSGVKQVADGKARGYAAMFELHAHKRLFPEATVPGFTVILVTTTPKRREALRMAMMAQPKHEIWRFCSTDDLIGEFLYSPIFYTCSGETTSVIKVPAGYTTARPREDTPS